MKGTLAVILAICISACASQPSRTVTSDQPAEAFHADAKPASTQDVRRSRKVFVDDYEMIHVRVNHPLRSTLILGRKSDSR